MSDLRAAAQMALEALEDAPYMSNKDDYARLGKTITALRAALDAPDGDCRYCTDGCIACDARKLQEPVALGAEWTPCVKLPVTVHVRQQRPGETHVSTREGITPVKPDDLIMRGVSGEEYPIGLDIFESTYQLGTAPTPRKPLTDEEIVDIWAGVPFDHDEQINIIDLARAVERAHGIGGGDE